MRYCQPDAMARVRAGRGRARPFAIGPVAVRRDGRRVYRLAEVDRRQQFLLACGFEGEELTTRGADVDFAISHEG